MTCTCTVIQLLHTIAVYMYVLHIYVRLVTVAISREWRQCY